MEKAESFQIYLNSKYASVYNNGLYNSDCDYILPTIEIPSEYQIYLSVQSAMIPYSFYNVDSYNNLLTVRCYQLNDYSTEATFIDPPIQITIPIGNYNAIQLASLITTYMNSNLVCTFNIITNTFTFTSTVWAFLFDYGLDSNKNKLSTALALFGFPLFINSVTTPTISYKSITTINIASLTSTTQINLSARQVLYISSNLSTGNILMTAQNMTSNNKNVLCCIPVTSGPYSTISYVNYNNFSVNLYSNILSTINIKILDINGNPINFNNQFYSLTLQLDIVNFIS